jgi:hypothetical protein
VYDSQQIIEAQKRQMSLEGACYANIVVIPPHFGSMATTKARDVVLHTPELLKNIISFLPVPDILTEARRISQLWNNVAADSPSIETRLWLKSRDSDVASPMGFLAVQDLPIHPVGLVDNQITLKLQRIWHRRMRDDLRRPLRMGFPAKDIVHTVKMPNSVRAQLPSEHQPSWLDIFITEPRITTARLTLELERGHD